MNRLLFSFTPRLLSLNSRQFTERTTVIAPISKASIPENSTFSMSRFNFDPVSKLGVWE